MNMKTAKQHLQVILKKWTQFAVRMMCQSTLSEQLNIYLERLHLIDTYMLISYSPSSLLSAVVLCLDILITQMFN
jgi:hypothetical protein